MADQEQLKLLKQSIAGWNSFRETQRRTADEARDFDWSEATLPGDFDTNVDLSGATLRGADLRGANLSTVGYGTMNLSRADLRGANLSDADLSRATLRGANLSDADLREADLSRVDLIRADLSDADLSGATLSDADLSGATLSDADLSGATLSRVDITGARVGGTHFDDVDLRTVKGLEGLNHRQASHISITTLYRSEGQIPESFLREAGVPEDFITYIHSLVNRPIKYYTCFISYSSKDQAFAERLYADLQSKNVRCWYAPEDLKIGDHYHQRIDESIRLYDKLVLILSEHALQSAWVEREVVAAREKEDREKRQVLFPLRLDETVMETTRAWAADVRRRWYIGDFTRWKEHDEYQKGLSRLLRDLKQDTVAP